MSAESAADARPSARRDDRRDRVQATVTEEDVVAPTLFLCSSAADNLTGQDINIAAGAVMY